MYAHQYRELVFCPLPGEDAMVARRRICELTAEALNLLRSGVDCVDINVICFDSETKPTWEAGNRLLEWVKDCLALIKHSAEEFEPTFRVQDRHIAIPVMYKENPGRRKTVAC